MANAGNLCKAWMVVAILISICASCDRTKPEKAPKQSATRSIAQDAEDSPDFAKRALDHSSRGEYREAVEAWTKAFELNPSFFPALLGRAQAYVHLGEFERAIADAEKAEAIEKTLPAKTGSGNVMPFRMKWSILMMIEKEKQRLGNKYGAMGAAAYEKGDYNEALRLMSLAITYTPQDSRHYSIMALSHGNLGNYTKAIEYSNEAIKRNPEDPKNFFNRGLAYMYLNEKANAVSDFNQCIKIGTDEQVTRAARQKLQALEQ